mgnify:CR=1 FL=1
MKDIRSILLLGLSLLALPIPVSAQSGIRFTRDIDSLMQSYVTTHDLPGLAIGLVQGDQLVWSEQYDHKGQQNKQQEPLVYNIASVAKPFVATAILLLVQEGKLSLDDPVVQYLPYFRLDSRFTAAITIRQLLTHTSGLPSVAYEDAYTYERVNTADDALEQYIRSLGDVKLQFKPGKKYSYSNVGYEVLGQLIAELSGQTFEAFMTARLFEPLQMQETSYFPQDFDQSRIAQPHDGHPYQPTAGVPYNREFSPSGNLFTTVPDLGRWMSFMLQQGVLDDFAPLEQGSFELLVSEQVDTGEGEFVGLSWYTMTSGSGEIIFHDGQDLGYRALLLLFPGPGIGVVALVNHLDADCNEIINLLLRSIRY